METKDEEIRKGSNGAIELEILLKKLEMENQARQRTTHEYESMLFSLNTTLEQMREKDCFFFNNGGGGAEDAESYCDVEEEDEEAEENRVMVCKACDAFLDSCVLFLPYRHLCSCKACDAFLDSCLVCLAPKKASIETLIS